MNVPKIKSYEEQAIDTVVSVINQAKEKLGMRMTLKQLAITGQIIYTLKLTFLHKNCDVSHTNITLPLYDIAVSPALKIQDIPNNRDFATNVKLSLKPIQPPYAITSEKFINETIKYNWGLGKTFQYFVRYMGGSRDEVSQYYYFEAIFSQPTVAYPIPQATVFVFFTLQDRHIDPPEKRGVPSMWFRIEGHHTDHDMRYVALQADWILAVIQMKIKLFKRIEAIRMF